MQVPGVAAPLWLILLLSGVANAVECTNVTIADADDAADVRGSCTVITGNLGFWSNVSVDINLDGVQEIQGDVTHHGCESGWEDCTIPDGFSISSSTLTKIGGGIIFWYFQGLEEISFPNLTTVQGTVSLQRLYQLTTLDITKLSHLGYFTLEAANLTSIVHEGLEGFTGENKYGNVIFSAAAVKSVDSFFSYPISVNGSAEQSGITLSSDYLPNLERVNFAWAHVPSLSISGDGINVTLGNSRSSTMQIDSLLIKGNITSLNRHASVDNLTIGELSVAADDSIKELELSFDGLTSLDVSTSDNLERIKLPESALSWNDFDLRISSCEGLNLSSEFDGSERVWYWPERNISSISITGVNVSNDFFDSFLEYHADGNDTLKVLKEFTVVPNDEQTTAFNCTPFDELKDRGVLPSEYQCSNVTDSAGVSLGVGGMWHYGVASAAIAFYLI